MWGSRLKIVVIDGLVAYTGGMNVADYYINGTPQVGEWHDMHCRIQGTEVNTLQAIFLRMWNKVTRQNIHGPQYFRGLGLDDYFMDLTLSMPLARMESRSERRMG